MRGMKKMSGVLCEAMKALWGYEGVSYGLRGVSGVRKMCEMVCIGTGRRRLVR